MKKGDWAFEAVGYGLIVVLVSLVLALCWAFGAIGELRHDNELLIAQKETLELSMRHIHCDSERFKYDPNTGSIYDNETKEIYRRWAHSQRLCIS
jgi:hypothetical protein